MSGSGFDPSQLPQDFAVGLILGPSNSGKTVLLQELAQNNVVRGGANVVGGVNFGNNDMNALKVSNKAIGSLVAIERLSSVGFNVIPSWCRPYSCLSNGEQARVRLAFGIGDGAVIDDFGITVDDPTCASMASSIQSLISSKAYKGIWIATTKPSVIPFLQPDFVIRLQAAGKKHNEAIGLRAEIHYNPYVVGVGPCVNVGNSHLITMGNSRQSLRDGSNTCSSSSSSSRVFSNNNVVKRPPRATVEFNLIGLERWNIKEKKWDGEVDEAKDVLEDHYETRKIVDNALTVKILKRKVPIDDKLKEATNAFDYTFHGISTSEIYVPKRSHPVFSGQIGAIVGPSGCGKTTIVNSLIEGNQNTIVDAHATDEIVANLLESGDEKYLSILNQLNVVGIITGRIRKKSEFEMSSTERHIVRTALLFYQSQTFSDVPIVIDEFTSCMDSSTRKKFADKVQRLARRRGVKLTVSGLFEEDILESLQPDWCIHAAKGLVTVQHRAIKGDHGALVKDHDEKGDRGEKGLVKGTPALLAPALNSKHMNKVKDGANQLNIEDELNVIRVPTPGRGSILEPIESQGSVIMIDSQGGSQESPPVFLIDSQEVNFSGELNPGLTKRDKLSSKPLSGGPPPPTIDSIDSTHLGTAVDFAPPRIRFDVSKCVSTMVGKDIWRRAFEKHHYLAGGVVCNAHCWLIRISKTQSTRSETQSTRSIGKNLQFTAASSPFKPGALVGFYCSCIIPGRCASMQFRECRVVILPGFQGHGLGPRLSDAIGARHMDFGMRYHAVTAHPRLGGYRETKIVEDVNSHAFDPHRLWLPNPQNMKLTKEGQTLAGKLNKRLLDLSKREPGRPKKQGRNSRKRGRGRPRKDDSCNPIGNDDSPGNGENGILGDSIVNLEDHLGIGGVAKDGDQPHNTPRTRIMFRHHYVGNDMAKYNRLMAQFREQMQKEQMRKEEPVDVQVIDLDPEEKDDLRDKDGPNEDDGDWSDEDSVLAEFRAWQRQQTNTVGDSNTTDVVKQKHDVILDDRIGEAYQDQNVISDDKLKQRQQDDLEDDPEGVLAQFRAWEATQHESMTFVSAPLNPSPVSSSYTNNVSSQVSLLPSQFNYITSSCRSSSQLNKVSSCPSSMNNVSSCSSSLFDNASSRPSSLFDNASSQPSSLFDNASSGPSQREPEISSVSSRPYPIASRPSIQEFEKGVELLSENIGEKEDDFDTMMNRHQNDQTPDNDRLLLRHEIIELSSDSEVEILSEIPPLKKTRTV